MPVITALKKTKHGLTAVFVDGVFWKSFNSEFSLERGLAKGLELSTGDIERLDQEGEARRALDLALTFLSYRARSVNEVKNRLIKAGYDSWILNTTLQRLEEVGCLNDQVFADEWVRLRADGRCYGKRRLANELRTRGVPDIHLKRAIAEHCDELDEERRAREAALNRMTRLESLDPRTARRRLISHLSAKGFDPAIIFRVTALVIAERETGE